jgi:hypothetical protein
MIDLKKLVLEKKTVTVDFPGMEGFKLDLCYLGPEALKKLRDKCIATKIDKKTRQAISELDDEKFAREFATSVVKGWKGFKAKYVTELMLADVSDLEEDTEIDYSEDNVYALFTTSNTFAAWVNEMVFDLSNFRG